MESTLIIVVGDHYLVRGLIQEFVKTRRATAFFSSFLDDASLLHPPSQLSYYEDLIAQEISREDDLLAKIKNGQSIIIEQWYLGLLTQIRLLNDSNKDSLEERVINRFNVFDGVSKKVLYVSTDIEKWNDESDTQAKRRQLSVLSDVVHELNLPEENINGEDGVEYIKKRTLFLLQDLK